MVPSMYPKYNAILDFVISSAFHNDSASYREPTKLTNTTPRLPFLPFGTLQKK